MPRAFWPLVALVGLAACGDDPAGVPAAQLELPAVIDLPYVEAGAGASEVAVTVANVGDAALVGDAGAALAWRVDDPAFTVTGPRSLAPGATATVTVRWQGAAAEAIAGATLTVEGEPGRSTAEVWAVAGAPGLAPLALEPVTGAGGVVIGKSAVPRLPTAPYPAPGRAWTDDRVHVFVPADWRERDAQDVVLHFHGHNTTIAATIAAHRYREQLYASGADAILIVPQGPVNAASGDFGKLADPAGTAALFSEVLIALYRAGVVTRPALGQVTLTSHSGGYVATAQNLAADAPFAVGQVDLYDSLYGYLEVFRGFARSGRPLRSNYTSGGGTLANNQQLAATLAADGLAVADAATSLTLTSPAPVIAFTAASHEGSTRDDDAYTEALRWMAPHGRRGPRVDLRAATAIDAGHARVRWRAPVDTDVTGWQLELIDASGATTTVAVEADATEATVPISGPTRVRVRPLVAGLAADAGQPSDTFVVGGAARVLIVDGFERVVDGSYGGLAHDAAARAGAGLADVATVSASAIREDAVDLAPYAAVIWLCGDDSTEDHTLTASERATLDAYLAGGGRVIVSGSEVGFDLGPTSAGRAWLAATAGATYAADDAGTDRAQGAGPLASLAAFGFGGPAALYREDYPDTFTAGAGATALLTYAGGASAAVGIAGRAAIVGFPLEVIDDDAARAAVVRALLAFVAP
ncbi:MAG: hypothetical protein IPH80_11815 [Myxococcales bacterium]|nr:hypothetical protein [Myxococcales bacterium]